MKIYNRLLVFTKLIDAISVIVGGVNMIKRILAVICTIAILVPYCCVTAETASTENCLKMNYTMAADFDNGKIEASA